MFRKVLVPLDGSDLSARSLEFLRPVLQLDSAQIVALHVREGSSVDENAPGLPDELLARLEELHPSAEVLTVARRGDPAAEILAVAKEADVSLIAMSTHDRPGLDRLVRGTVAERVLRNADVPVLFTTPSTKQRQASEVIRRIVVPLDGSRLAASVLSHVADIARVYGSQVTLLHVDLPGNREHRHSVERARAKKRAFAKLVSEQVAELEQAGATVSTQVVFGFKPVAEILAFTEREAIDLVVLATRGRRGLARLAFGSIAEQIIAGCQSPLLVERVPEDSRMDLIESRT